MLIANLQCSINYLVKEFVGLKIFKTFLKFHRQSNPSDFTIKLKHNLDKIYESLGSIISNTKSTEDIVHPIIENEISKQDQFDDTEIIKDKNMSINHITKHHKFQIYNLRIGLKNIRSLINDEPNIVSKID